MSSNIGERLKISIFGQSHGAAIGAVVDGLPAGIPIDEAEIARDMARRAPRSVKGSTARREADLPEIVSGIYDGRTTGFPICAIIRNGDTRSRDYENLRQMPRPSHADYAAMCKYGGFADMRGGGHFSGRLTAPLVFAGALCRQFLAGRGVRIGAHLLRVGDVADAPFDPLCISAGELEEARSWPFPARPGAAERMMERIEAARMDRDSMGAVVECAAVGLPAGWGEPMFDGVEPHMAKYLFAIPAVKGVEFGAGFGFAAMRGSQANDQMSARGGAPEFLSNNCGGILGGITSGAPLIVRVAFKPTSSISKPQRTIDMQAMQEEELVIQGRHDSCVAVRGVAVVEAAAALSLAELCLLAQPPCGEKEAQ